MKNLLDKNGCMDYLENMAYTNILFTGENSGNYYFVAFDQDNEEMHEIEFHQETEEKILVSVRELGKEQWNILEFLQD